MYAWYNAESDQSAPDMALYGDGTLVVKGHLAAGGPPVHDVRYHGARAGQTDSTAAFQSAWDAAADDGGVVSVPNLGSAWNVGTLTPTDGAVGVLGIGLPTIQQMDAGARIIDATSIDDFTLSGVLLKGNASGAETSANQLARFTTCDDLTIEASVFENGWHRSIYLIGCADFRVSRNRFRNCSNGPYFTGCSDGEITRNRISGSQQADGTFKVGLALQTYDATYGLCRDVLIAGNRVTGFKNSQAYLAHGGLRLTFLGNASKDCSNGMTLSAASASDTQDDAQLVGNTFVGVGAVAYTVTYDMGISVNGTQAANDGTTLIGNTIVGFNLDAQNEDWGGVSVLGATRLYIGPNMIRDGWGNGVVFSGANSSARIEGLSVVDVTGTGAIGGIKIDSPTVVSGRFTGNHITGCTNAYRLATASLPDLVVESATEASNDAASNGAAACVFNGRLAPADGDTTPSVKGGVRVIVFNNTNPTTVTNLDDGEVGQVIVMRCSNGNTTLSENSDGGGNFHLDSNSNLTIGNRDTASVMYDGTRWLAVALSTNV